MHIHALYLQYMVLANFLSTQMLHTCLFHHGLCYSIWWKVQAIDQRFFMMSIYSRLLKKKSESCLVKSGLSTEGEEGFLPP